MNYRHNTIQYEVGDVARDLDDGLLGRLTHELQRHNTIQYEVGDVARDLDDGLLGRLTHELQTQYNTIRGWGRGTRP